MADDDEPESRRIRTLDERFGEIRSEQQEQRGVLDRILSLLPGAGQPSAGHEAPKDGAGEAGSVQEQVRAELQRAREEEAAAKARADAEDADKSERQQMRDELAKLRERPPKGQTPRRTRMLGWGE